MQTITSYGNLLSVLQPNEDIQGEVYKSQQLQDGFKEEFQQESKQGLYVLDYSLQQYLQVDEGVAACASQPIDEIMRGGIQMTSKLWHPDDYRTYDEVILPANVAFMNTLHPSEYRDLRFTCNYRVKNRSNGYTMVEQVSRFDSFTDNGLPKIVVGMVRDITNRVTNSIITHTIKSVNPASKTVSIETYDPQIKRKNFDMPVPELTIRQLQILKQVVQGYKNEQIASSLSLTKDMVEHDRKAIIIRLGASNIAEAVSRAYEFGVLKASN
ncbi:response regulator transcription factor [Mucilaginibacter terrae]|uniref:response regulator transcription factor n=1 Tax=Mucilaginibacter terrae TaxID=1955052 RepID=UPI0036258583